MTNARIFFAGVGTTILLIGAGFSGGLMLAKTALEPVAPAPHHSAAEPLPPVRIILPSSAEAAAPPQPPSANLVEPARETGPRLFQTSEVQKLSEGDRSAERAERRKAEATEQERRKRTSHQKAKR